MGYKILEKRKEAKISQEELSEKAGVSRAIISDLETGKKTNTTAATLLKLANALGCTVHDLFY